MLGLDLDSWNIAMLLSLGFGALAAFAVVVSTAAVIKLQRAAEVETKQEFDRYRIEAGENIANANARALEAQLALEQFKAPRPMTPELTKRLTDDVLPLIPMDRKPSIGALPANVNNLQFAAQVASVLGTDINQGAAETQVGPTRGVVAMYVTLNERGKRLAEAFAKALNDSGIDAAAVPGLMERIFHPVPNNPNFVPMDPTQPGQSWVVIVVGDKP